MDRVDQCARTRSRCFYVSPRQIGSLRTEDMNFLTTPKRTTSLMLTIGLFALALTTTVLLYGSNPSPPSSTQPKITWSVASVYAGITSTTTVTKTLSFKSNQALQGVVVEAVPQIAGFVQ